VVVRKINIMENRNDQNKAPWWQPGLMLFGRLSSWIIGPVLVGVIVGKWLDKKYGTDPWLFLICVGAAFLLSMVGIVRDAMKEMKRIEEQEKKSKLQNPNIKSQPEADPPRAEKPKSK